ncbi:unnamed protein product [Strongylus vulgaris]|uniref:Uncharacterized protein n=1 Tax=Strongylus vulgaris TaxID=40348 RepID=A0A3P7JZY9_STRVU|nr:unnamed protein product [Strongylus vulgaris]
MGIQGQQMGTQGIGQNPYNQQVLSMDPFQQQQQLFMMQSQQMQPVFQQQQQQQVFFNC